MTVVNLSASEWQLFTEIPAAERAAAALNKTLNTCFASGYDYDKTVEEMALVMGEYCELGAFDTEPRTVLWELLDKHYGA